MSIKKCNLKLFIALKQKKNREKYGLFVVEGEKIVLDFLEKTEIKLHSLFSTKKINTSYNYDIISEKELSKVSSQKTPNKLIAIFHIPQKQKIITHKQIVLALDGINDPGNLGTIIRLCDWFGIKNIICSKNTVNCYNTKVVQSSMGSLGRVNIIYTDLDFFLKNWKGNIFGAFLDGENISNIKNEDEGVIIMGNEAKGISLEIQKLITKKITIPNKNKLVDSLNVAMATGIVLYEFTKK